MTRSSLSSGTRPSLPADLSDALGVVDGLTESRSATMAMLYENRMVGDAGVVGGAPVRLAQAGTMTSLAERERSPEALSASGATS